jgi:hypothetical protein
VDCGFRSEILLAAIFALHRLVISARLMAMNSWSMTLMSGRR